MNQLPTEIWQEIAQEQPLKTEAAKLSFPMKQTPQDEMMERWQDLVDSDPKIAVALTALAPVWIEREAIRRYLNSSRERSGLRQVLPELGSPEEVAALAKAEYWLTPTQTQQFLRLLKNGHALTTWQTAASAPTA
jgi:hypothetical protein